MGSAKLRRGFVDGLRVDGEMQQNLAVRAEILRLGRATVAIRGPDQRQLRNNGAPNGRNRVCDCEASSRLARGSAVSGKVVGRIRGVVNK